MPANKFGRPVALAVLSFGFGAGLLFLANSSHGQKGRFPPPPPPPIGVPVALPETTPGAGTSAQFSAIKLVSDSKKAQVIEAARDYLRARNWEKVVEALQPNVLDSKENFYVQIRERDSNGRDTMRWASAKFEANKLLGTMPEEGLDVYEDKCGAIARDMLDEAKKKGDRDTMATVARVAEQFMYTKAGIEANDILATYFLDRGQYFVAALRLEKILEMNPERTKLSDLTLFKACLAYSRTGDTKRQEEAWKRLAPRLEARNGLKIGEDVVAMVRLKEFLADNTRPANANLFDWKMVHGNQQRNAQANGSQPALDYTIFPASSTIADESGENTAAKSILEDAIREEQKLDLPVLSGFFPIVANKMVIFRTHKDIHAVSLYKTKDPSGKEIPAGETVWRAGGDNSLVAIMEAAKLSPTLRSYLAQFGTVPGYRSFIYENSLIGSICADDRMVYALDDLAIPAAPNMLQWLNQPQGAALKPRVLQNVLSAFDVTTGKWIWKLGKWSFETDSADANDERENQFANSHFLSVPISVGGKLYVLNEKNSGLANEADLRLVCIDPDPNKVKNGRPHVVPTEGGKLAQEIGTVAQNFRYINDPIRRTHSAYMAYGEGIIVCTTNAGDVLGVDLLSRSLAWSYPYRESAPANQVIPPGPAFQPRPIPVNLSLTLPTWKSAPPVIQNGKVVFTAPDAGSIHCINLRDGTPVWKKKHQEGDLYFAGVFAGKVLIVAKNSIRVLRLSDGAQLWQEPTLGTPSGQGVASKNIYYLPLKKSETSEIVALDLDRLAVKSRNPSVTSKDDVGNLVFYDGMVLSQSPTALVAYPELKVQLARASIEVEANPNNPVSLFKRGKWLLADGQVQLAVNDLQKSLKNDLPEDMRGEARRKLFLAMSDLMQVNFKDAGPKYLVDYRDICNVPDNKLEQEDRLSKYFRVVGEGYESVGNLVDAFKMYREFGSIQRGNLVSTPADPSNKVPTNVWLRGRISAMMEHARPEQKEPLNARIAEEWREVKSKKNIDAMRSFVDMFDVPVPVGREARLHLAETIVERDDRPAFLEAELNLQQLRGNAYFSDENVSARALAALGKLEEKKTTPDAMKLAATYYRELRNLYPRVLLADGKTTGTKLLDELTTDPRFLHLLEEPGPLWTNETIRSRELRDLKPSQQGFVFQPDGDATPLMKQTRLLLENTMPPRLHCYNFGNSSLRWTVELGTPQFNQQVFQVLYSQSQPAGQYNPNARFRFYQVRGNLAVIQVGTVAYCLDMEAGRILWQQNLFEGPSTPNFNLNHISTDHEGNLRFMFMAFVNGMQQIKYMNVGHVGAVQPAYVALVTPKGLVVVDPLRGTPLWRKADAPLTTRVFGDEQYLFTVDVAEGAAVGVGRAYRAIDGSIEKVPDFGPLVPNRIRSLGRKLLLAVPGAEKTLKLYDILAGKDVWEKAFHANAAVLATEDPGLTGVIEPDGKATVLDVEKGKVVFQGSVLQARVNAADVANLDEPLLLQDRDRWYFALNQPIGPGVTDGILYNNFGNGLRSRKVNGWVLSFFREDGQHMNNKKFLKHKKGDFDWCSPVKIENQLVLVEQFDNLPVMLFSARFQPSRNNWASVTQCLHRGTGKRLYWSGPKQGGQLAPFGSFAIDAKEGTINLIGLGINSISVQFFLDDGRRMAAPAGAARLGEAVGPAQNWSEFGDIIIKTGRPAERRR